MIDSGYIVILPPAEIPTHLLLGDFLMDFGTSQQALGGIQQAQNSAQTPQALLAAQNAQLGVQGEQDRVMGMRGAITNTTKLLNQVAPSVMGRTAGSLVTNAQATRQIGNEEAPISKTLGQQSSDYNTANQDYTDLSNKAKDAASLEYQGQQDKLSYLQNIYNSLFQREQAAQDWAEKVREFNASLKSSGSGSAGLGNLASLFGGDTGTSAPTPTSGNPIGDRAYAAVSTLLGTDDKRIRDSIAAISKSAGFGNSYDQAKLQLLKTLAPKYFQPVKAAPTKKSAPKVTVKANPALFKGSVKALGL